MIAGGGEARSTVDADAVQRMADAVLIGVYQGDLAVALERAAAFFRVIATGRCSLGASDKFGIDGVDLAARNERVAAALSSAARHWRAGTLH